MKSLIKKIQLSALLIVCTIFVAGCVPHATLTCTVKISTSAVKTNGVGTYAMPQTKDISVSGELVASSTAQAMAKLFSAQMPDAS